MAEQVVSRKEIVAQAEKLAQLISESEEVVFFKRAEQQIKKNEKVQRLIQSIKRHQKHAVQFEHYDKSKSLQGTEQKLADLHAEIDAIPLVQEFKQSQNEVNDLLQMITSIISNHVTKHIIESTGGNVLHGETGGGSERPSCPL